MDFAWASAAGISLLFADAECIVSVCGAPISAETRVAIVDTRNLSLNSKFFRRLRDDPNIRFGEVALHDQIILVMPATTSSPEYVVNIECAIHCFGQYKCFLDDAVAGDLKPLKMIRLDDFYSPIQDAILRTMLLDHPDCTIYGETESILGLIQGVDDLRSESRFEKGVYSKRAYTCWAVAACSTEEDVLRDAMFQKIIPALRAGKVCPRVGTSTTTHSGVPARMNISCPSARRADFYCLSTKSLSEYESAAKCHNVSLQLCRKNAEEVKMVPGSIVNLIVSMPDIKGLTNCRLFKDVCRAARSSATDSASRESVAIDATLLTVIFVIEDYDTLKQNLWLITIMESLIDDCDIVLFALKDELEGVIAAFSNENTLHKECFQEVLQLNLCPFPRLHFLTTHRAIGQELQEDDIINVAVSFGGVSMHSFAAEQFRAMSCFSVPPGKQYDQMLMMSDSEFKPMVERVVQKKDVGELGQELSAMSFISPGRLLMKLWRDMLDDLALRKNSDGEEPSENDSSCRLGWAHPRLLGRDAAGSDVDEMDLTESESNLHDLLCEFSGVYSPWGATAEDDSEEHDEAEEE